MKNEQSKSLKLAVRDSLKDPEKRRKVIYIISGLVIFLLAIPKIYPLISNLDIFSTPTPEEVILVDAHLVQAGQLDNKIGATGTLRAIQEVELRAEVAGKVIGLYIEEGSTARQGQLLVKVNDNDLQTDKRRLESNIKVMEESADRQQQLFERGGATQEDFDNTMMQLNNIRAEYAAIQVQIERTEVRAPFDGVVGLTYIDNGAYITPSTRIASLQNMQSMRLDFSIPERYAARIQRDSEVLFTVQGVDSVFTARVVATEPQIDPRSRTVRIRAVSDNADGHLNPGAFASVELILESYENTILIPPIALVPDTGSYKVYVFENGTVRSQPVITGVRTRDQVQIITGLLPGDTILTSGHLQISEGSPVEIRNLGNSVEYE